MCACKITENLRLGPLATFSQNKRLPVYNWFDYQEGFSRDLIFLLAQQFNLESSSLVLDSFCGVGTTQLACKQLGVPSTGIDASPLAIFAARTKLGVDGYDVGLLRATAKNLFAQKFERPQIPVDTPPIVQRAFSKYALEDLIFLRNPILKIDDEDIRNFFLLGLATAALQASFSKKDGAVIRIVKRGVPPLRVAFKSQILRMMKDVERWSGEKGAASAEIGDARDLRSIATSSIDAVITSPPYLNKLEYTKVHAIEEWILADVLEKTKTSYLGSQAAEKDVFSGKYKMPAVAQTYFADMDLVLAELARVCKPEAKVALVIGNGCFPDFEQPIVESDVLLAELAERHNFKCKKIIAVSKRWCTTAARKKVGTARESIVFLVKSI